MIEFSHPWVLLLGLPVSLLFAWLWRVGPRVVRLPFDEMTWNTGHGTKLLPRGLELTLWLLVMSLLVILAGPLQRTRGLMEREMTNIMLVLDVSGSMNFDFSKTKQRKFDTAVDKLGEFAQKRRGDTGGLVIFAKEALPVLPLTDDLAALRPMALAWQPLDRKTGAGVRLAQGTNIKAGLEAAADQLMKGKGGDRMVVLLTDGQDPENLTDSAAEEIMDDWKQRGIHLHVILIDVESSNLLLEKMATELGGGVHLADDPGALQRVFERIDRMHLAQFVTTADRLVPVGDMWVWTPLFLCFIHVCTLGLGLRYTPW